jgi:hypothetical protein
LVARAKGLFSAVKSELKEYQAVNDSKDPKNLPPDDFSKTTPYVRVPKEDSHSSSSRDDYTSDWEKTNFNYSIPKTTSPPPGGSQSSGADDWGKTAVNINIPRRDVNNPPDDFNKTFMPGQSPRQPQQPSAGWDMTQANINLAGHEDFGGPKQTEYNATTPYIQLPEAERAKILNPGHPHGAAEEEKKEEKKPPTPAWVWFAGVAGLFFLITTVLVGAYFLFSNRYGYDVMVLGAQPNSDI